MKILNFRELETLKDNDLNIKVEIELEDGKTFSTQNTIKIDFDGFFENTPLSFKNSPEIPNIAKVLVGKELSAPQLDQILLEIESEFEEKTSKQTQTNYRGAQLIKTETDISRAIFKQKKILTSIVLYSAYAYQEQVELYELFAYLIGAETVMLPCTQLNIFSDSNNIESNLFIKDFFLAPIGAESLEMAIMGYKKVGKIFKEILQKTRSVKNDEEILQKITNAIDSIKEKGLGTCAISIVPQANKFYNNNQKKYLVGDKSLSGDELIEFYKKLVEIYPIYSIESGASIHDWLGWNLLITTFANKIQITKNFQNYPNFTPQDIVETILSGKTMANGLIIDPIQIGTVMETLQIIELIKNQNINPIISSENKSIIDFLSDLSVGTSSGQFKIPGTPEYKRLIEIERQLIKLK